MEALQDDEAALWARCVAGDAAAVGVIFDRHRDRVFRHAYRLLLSAADAEDATAVAFLELWRRRKHVRVVEGSVLPWLLVTATNTTRNMKRSSARYRRLLESLPHGEHHESAEESALAHDIADTRLAVALAKLSPADLHLVTLVVIEGTTSAAAAQALGLTPGAARTRLHRARTLLREQLGHPTLTLYRQAEGDSSWAPR